MAVELKERNVYTQIIPDQATLKSDLLNWVKEMRPHVLRGGLLSWVEEMRGIVGDPKPNIVVPRVALKVIEKTEVPFWKKIFGGGVRLSPKSI